jgi:hypothetical protein
MPVTSRNQPPTVVEDEPEFPTLEEVVASAAEALDARDREYPHLKLEANDRELLLAEMRILVPEAIARKRNRDFWRGFCQRRGLRAAERLTFMSRYHLLMAIAGLEKELGVHDCMQKAVERAVEFEEEVKQKLAKGARRP